MIMSKHSYIVTFFGRFAAWVLVICVMIGALPPLKSMAAYEEDSGEYQIYLADFLSEYQPLKKDVGFEMLHRKVYKEIQAQPGFTESIETYRFLTDTGSIVFEDKTQMYKQVILEILQKQTKSRENQERIQEEYEFFRDTILENALLFMDFGPEVFESDSTLRVAISGVDLSKLGDTFWNSTIFGQQMAGAVSNASAETKAGISLCANMVLNVAKNVLEYSEKMALYLTMSEYRQGTLEFIEHMYRQTSNVELMTALRSVADSIRAVNSHDMVKLVTDLEEGFRLSTLTDILVSTVQQWCGAAGLMVSGATLLTNLTFNSGQIGELALLLEAQAEVEAAVQAGLRYMINSYNGSYEKAVALNAGAYMLYDTYEYGLELAVAYAEAVLDQGLVNQIGKKIAESIGKGMYGPNYVPKDNSFAFKELAASYQNMVKVNRTVFDSVREMFAENHPSRKTVKNLWENRPVLMQGLIMDPEPLLIDLGSPTASAGWAVSAHIQPANADAVKIIYSSSNTEVVEVDEAGFLTPHKAGVAQITAVTEEGLFTASRQVIVTRGKELLDQGIVISYDETKDYSKYYRKNEDGITLLKPVRSKMKKGDTVNPDFDWLIPEYLDGQPVTEIDFSEKQVLVMGNGYDIPFVIPDTVKRIAPRCFEGQSFCDGVVFSKNLESIGEEAFKGAQMSGAYSGFYEDKYVIIPESVQYLGKGAFQGARFEGAHLVLQGSFEKLPEDCFRDASEMRSIKINCPQLKEIGNHAFSSRLCLFMNRYDSMLSIPDTVERIGAGAFCVCNLADGKLPEGLREIGEEAFFRTSIQNGEGVLTLPESLKVVGEKAFYAVNCSSVVLPEKLEKIGDNAFSRGTMRTVTCYGDNPEAGSGVMGNEVFAECGKLTRIQIPTGITQIGEGVFDRSSLRSIEWPAGLTGMGKQAINTTEGLLFQVRGTGSGENAALPEQLFSPDISNYRSPYLIPYLELPRAFAGSLNLAAFDNIAEYYAKPVGEYETVQGVYEMMIHGVVKEIIPGAYAKTFEDFVWNAVYALDENGNTVCLYKREETDKPYTKYSQAKYENAEEYRISFPEETTKVTEQIFGGSLSVRVNADDAAVSAIGARPMAVYQWQDQKGKDRAKELGEFLEFEDLYLYQPKSFYYKIGLKDGDTFVSSLPGEYQITFQIGSDWDYYSTAAYHIDENGFITRLCGEVVSNGANKEYRVLSHDIGSFAVVNLENLSMEMSGSIYEELHDLYRQEGEEILSPSEDGGASDDQQQSAHTESGQEHGQGDYSGEGENSAQTKGPVYDIIETVKEKAEELVSRFTHAAQESEAEADRTQAGNTQEAGQETGKAQTHAEPQAGGDQSGELIVSGSAEEEESGIRTWLPGIVLAVIVLMVSRSMGRRSRRRRTGARVRRVPDGKNGKQ